MPLSPYPWNDAYRIGLESVDAQHRTLFEIVGRIYALEEHPDTKDAIRGIFYDLSDYMQQHFANEEAYMAAIGYPGLNEHREHHRRIIEGVATLVRNPVRLDILKTKMKVAAKRMLVDHILIEDLKIKAWAQRYVDPMHRSPSEVALTFEEETLDV